MNNSMSVHSLNQSGIIILDDVTEMHQNIKPQMIVDNT